MTTADIATLPLAEKLMLMERLWDALRAQSDASVVPAWHQSVLSERLRQLDAGVQQATPWAEAKERIRAQSRAG
jgi:putative addiction module component (TIGR02574 family)